MRQGNYGLLGVVLIPLLATSSSLSEAEMEEKRKRGVDIPSRGPPLRDYINTPVGTDYELESFDKNSRIYTFKEAYHSATSLILDNKPLVTMRTSVWCLFQGDRYAYPFIFNSSQPQKSNILSSAKACELVKYRFDISEMNYHTDLVMTLMGLGEDNTPCYTRMSSYDKYLGRFIPPDSMRTFQRIHFVPRDRRFDVVCR